MKYTCFMLYVPVCVSRILWLFIYFWFRSFKLATHKPSASSMANNAINRTNNDTNIENWQPLPEFNCIPWVVALILECLAIVTLNIITSLIFLTKRQLQRRSAILIIHLAITDFLVGAVSGPLQSYHIGRYCNLWKYGANSLVMGSIIKTPAFYSLLNLAAI